MDEATFASLLDGVYDAATAFDRWPAALERLGHAFGCSYVGLIDRDARTMRGRAAAYGVDIGSQREYFEVWSKQDALQMRTWTYRAGAVETDHDIMPRRDLLGSDYYNGFMKPRDMHAFLRMTLTVDDGRRHIVSMTRPASRGDYGAVDIERCRRLTPHLQRAAGVMQRLEESQLMLDASLDVLEQSSTGVVLLDRTGRVSFANDAARAMVRTGDALRLRCERIEAASARDDAALQRVIAGATGRIGATDKARSGAMRLARASGRPDLAIVVAPLASATCGTGPAAFALVTDPDTRSMRPETMIRQLYGLSAAEARVAERLTVGDSPEQAAAALNIRVSTARWHLAALYRKTGVSRQAQLVRLLLSVPAI